VARAPLFLEPRLAELVASHLDRGLVRVGGAVGAWCVMPEHVHAILVGARDVVQWVALLKAGTTTAARRADLVGRIWQRRFHDRSLDPTTPALEAATTYLVENPVRRGLVTHWEDWPHVRIGWT